MYTSQQSVADQIEAILDGFKGRVPTYPIFSGVDDPMVRALLALLVGCDACPGGVKGKGPMVAFKLLKKYGNKLSGGALHEKLADDISTMKGASVDDKDAALCLAKSLLYKKTNDGYIHNSPIFLQLNVTARLGIRTRAQLILVSTKSSVLIA